MTHYFYCTPENARRLTALRKKFKKAFYFRTLTRTNDVEEVFCESNLNTEVLNHYAIRFDTHFIKFL